MPFEVLILGDLDIQLPNPFKIVKRKIQSHWSIEFNDKKFVAAIICLNSNEQELLSNTLILLKDKFGIRHLSVHTKNLTKDLIIKALNQSPGLKFFSSIDNLNYKTLLPDPIQLSKMQQQEIYQKSLSILHRASSVSAIEQGLKNCLEEYMGIDVVRLTFPPHSERLVEQFIRIGKTFLAQEYEYSPGQKAKLIFFRNSSQTFRKYEHAFLEKITEASFLSLKRILRLEHLETLEQHWTTTFNAFDAAIGVFNSEGKLIKANRTFEKYFGTEVTNYQKLNSAGEWPPRKMEQIIQITDKKYDIHFHHYTHGWITVLRDISEKEKLERQILESSKMAELGMIGSSIAHEINNPLGGMLSYIQLILMDINKDHNLFEDIKEMELATLKCKTIVENLLGFARKQDENEKSKINLFDIIEEAIKLCQFPIKYKGTQIINKISNSNIFLMGSSNNLVQAIKNILQNAIEATEDHQGMIEVELSTNKDKYELIISDNGKGIPSKVLSKIFNPLFSTKNSSKHPGLGLTVAFQIIQDHNGNLEFFSQPKGGTRAVISFQRLDLIE